jgi:hypothetical protein
MIIRPNIRALAGANGCSNNEIISTSLYIEYLLSNNRDGATQIPKN